MSFNTFGKFFRFTTWGESHGPAIGCIIDGCPPLIQLKEQDIQKELDKRRPGQSKFTTQRKEQDKFCRCCNIDPRLKLVQWNKVGFQTEFASHLSDSPVD